MKTITFKGKVYQIGKLYFFYDSAKARGEIARLVGSGGSILTTADNTWMNCEVVNGELGTIEDAPIKLEDGEWYMCEDNVKSHATRPVKYHGDGYWAFSDRSECAGKCDWLNPLYKMVKA